MMQFTLQVSAELGVNSRICCNDCSTGDSMQVSYHADWHVQLILKHLVPQSVSCVCFCRQSCSSWPARAKSTCTMIRCQTPHHCTSGKIAMEIKLLSAHILVFCESVAMLARVNPSRHDRMVANGTRGLGPNQWAQIFS